MAGIYPKTTPMQTWLISSHWRQDLLPSLQAVEQCPRMPSEQMQWQTKNSLRILPCTSLMVPLSMPTVAATVETVETTAVIAFKCSICKEKQISSSVDCPPCKETRSWGAHSHWRQRIHLVLPYLRKHRT